MIEFWRSVWKWSKKKTQACVGEFFLFFVCRDLLSAETRVLSSRKTLIRKTHNHTLLNMTARITYKRRYVLDALLAFFFCFVCIRSERKPLDATRARFGTFLVRAREGDIYTCADEEILSAFFSLLLVREKKDFARNFTRGERGGNAKVEWAHARLICARVHSLRATTTIREAG